MNRFDLRRSLGTIERVLKGVRIDPAVESRAQDQIALALKAAGVEFTAEERLSDEDRIDFLCAGGVGIEVKVKGNPMEIFRQAGRYLRHERVAALIVASSKTLTLPRTIEGKDCLVVWTGAAWI